MAQLLISIPVLVQSLYKCTTCMYVKIFWFFLYWGYIMTRCWMFIKMYMYCNQWESVDQQWLNDCHKWIIWYVCKQLHDNGNNRHFCHFLEMNRLFYIAESYGRISVLKMYRRIAILLHTKMIGQLYKHTFSYYKVTLVL